jgi:hypothetical protein
MSWSVPGFEFRECTSIVAFCRAKDLPEAGEEELSMMTKIVDKMTKGDLDLR